MLPWKMYPAKVAGAVTFHGQCQLVKDFENRYVKLTGTWNLCWRAKFLEGLTGSVCFLARPSTLGGVSPECSRRKWRFHPHFSF
ncbi:hypothetical protein NSB25_04865 [Acetatifactor muris]|uniref:hypothetical protein n=1 Tax=Acetatifactor muris TaxID=879566 RepID=UPI0011AF099B|nr:hypothetical protein [Acetatifactor muris]MCR2046609.1 hypothetical protein [Acetatifactor muris]